MMSRPSKTTNRSKSSIKNFSKRKRSAKEELRAQAHDLAERVKELEVIHSLSDLFEARNVELGEVFQRVVELLPTAWQFPELACARIVLKNRTYQSANYKESDQRIQENILSNAEHVGTLEVSYCEPRTNGSYPEFLAEEIDLLTTVARRLSEAYALKESQLQLATYQQHLRSLASELTLTEERERRQLALHLHDSISQGLAVTKLKLETLRFVLPDEHKERVDDIVSLLQDIIADTRSITAQISPPILYELSFCQALVWLGDHFKKEFGLQVAIHSSEQDFPLGDGVRVMLFRSIQELLTNVVKHAQATSVNVHLERNGNEVHVIVEDNGVGFDKNMQQVYPSASGGFGIFSIRERFAHLGGRMAIDAETTNGARINLWVPIIE